MKRKVMSLMLALVMVVSFGGGFSASAVTEEQGGAPIAPLYDLGNTRSRLDTESEWVPMDTSAFPTDPTADIPTYAATEETPIIVGGLSNPGDTATYEVQIDHALYPEAILYAFTYGAAGNATIRVYDENNSLVTGIVLRNKLDDNVMNTILAPKGAVYIRNSDAATIKYKVTVETETGDVGYAMKIGTMDTFVEDYGGRNNVTTVAKNTSPKAAYDTPAFFRSPQMLLNNDGDWFRYTADGYTYITARIDNKDCLAFEVYDATNNTLVYRTNSKDRGIETYADSTYQGHVQKGLELEKGKDYLIRFYTTSYISTTKPSDTYAISIGYPFITSYKLDCPSQQFYVPANTTKTFYIDVSDPNIPSSARANCQTTVRFTAGSSLNNTYVKSCQITAPNGYTFYTSGGLYHGFENPSTANYLTDSNHVPIRGTWKVTIRTSKAFTFYFRISQYCAIILGNDGD